MLKEATFVSQVDVSPQSGFVSVRWSTVITKDDTVISESYRRKGYNRSMISEFIAEVENSAAYMQALGWTVDG